MNSCCYNCPNRTYDCHAKCDTYAAERQYADAVRDVRSLGCAADDVIMQQGRRRTAKDYRRLYSYRCKIGGEQ